MSDTEPVRRVLAPTAVTITLAALLCGVLAPSSMGAEKSGSIAMPEASTLSANGARGMECLYASHRGDKDPLSQLVASEDDPVVSVPSEGSAIAALVDTPGLPFPRAVIFESAGKRADLVGDPLTVPGAASAHACAIVTNAGTTAIGAQVTDASGHRQWWIIDSFSGATRPVVFDDQSVLTPAATLSSDGAHLFIVSAPCAACGGAYAVHSFDTATGLLTGTFAVPTSAAGIRDGLAQSLSGVTVGSSQGRLLVSAATPDALDLWSLDPATLTVRGARTFATQPGHGPASTSSCRSAPGLQIIDGAIIAAAELPLDFSDFAPGAKVPLDLPRGQTLTLIDATTLADRVSFETYRPSRVPRTPDNAMCPYAGPGGYVHAAGNIYRPDTAELLGWDSSSDQRAGRVQGGERVWSINANRGEVNFRSAKRRNVNGNWTSFSGVPTLQEVRMEEIPASPTWARVTSSLQGMLDGDYQVDGLWSGEESATITVDVRRRGSTYRYVARHGYWKTKGLRVTYANPSISCARTTTKALPDTIAADRRARWTCTKGSSGWKQGRVLASNAVQEQLKRFDRTMAREPTAILIDSSLDRPDATRLEWDRSFTYRPESWLMACSSASQPDRCALSWYSGSGGFSGTSQDLDLRRGSGGIPRLTDQGRLAR